MWQEVNYLPGHQCDPLGAGQGAGKARPHQAEEWRWLCLVVHPSILLAVPTTSLTWCLQVVHREFCCSQITFCFFLPFFPYWFLFSSNQFPSWIFAVFSILRLILLSSLHSILFPWLLAPSACLQPRSALSGSGASSVVWTRMGRILPAPSPGSALVSSRRKQQAHPVYLPRV